MLRHLSQKAERCRQINAGWAELMEDKQTKQPPSGCWRKQNTICCGTSFAAAGLLVSIRYEDGGEKGDMDDFSSNNALFFWSQVKKTWQRICENYLLIKTYFNVLLKKCIVLILFLLVINVTFKRLMKFSNIKAGQISLSGGQHKHYC